MKKLAVMAVVGATLAFTVSASAALVPGVFDPGSTGCVESTYSKKTKTLHLEKNCPTPTVGTNADRRSTIRTRWVTSWLVPR